MPVQKYSSLIDCIILKTKPSGQLALQTL